MNKSFLGALLALLMLACDTQEKIDSSQTLFRVVPSSESGMVFTNAVENQKEMNIFKYRNYYNGGGVAIGDINNDGLPDIYLSANMTPNKLFLNKGNLQFEDISVVAGVEGAKPWSTGVSMVDINQDGFLDIYVSNAGNLEGSNQDNDLYINNGDLTFTERAKEYNLAETGFSTHASFFDYDKDGDLDAYILNNSNIPVSSLNFADNRKLRAQNWNVPQAFRGVGDLLMRNDGGKFVDVSEEAGIYGSLIGFGLGVYVTDINLDDYPDIYVSNDFYERDYLYINNQDGTFTEDIKNWTSHLCLSAMGVDMADVNNDGLNDIFVTDMMPEEDQRIKSVMEFEGYNVFKLKQSKDFYQQYIQNTLQLNNGNGTFSEIAYFSGLAKTDWSWAGLIFDMDNNGYKDIYVTNGINHDLTDIDFVDFFANEVIQKLVLTGKKEEITSIINRMPQVPLSNYAFENNGDLTFENSTEKWGIGVPSFSNGCAYGDLDNDGDLDLVVNNVNMESFLFENRSSQMDRNYLRFTFEGGEKNRNALGTKLKAFAGDQVILQEHMPFRGFQSSMDYTLVMGLGDLEKVDSLVVKWPNDAVSVLYDLEVNQTINLNQSEGGSETGSPETSNSKTYLVEGSNTELQRHVENYFNDFDYEGMISSQLSQEGPSLAVADVDGDGDDDVFIGGAKGQGGIVYLHEGGGNLKRIDQQALSDDAGFEDTAAAFLDADGDGDQDLLVGSGGNEKSDVRFYMPRLYLNNGNGQFTRSGKDLPSTQNNIGTIAPQDFDGDGDVDVFIGSRSVPGVYGINPEHQFLMNDGEGNFTDATERVAFATSKAGMVTAATWGDMNGDGRNDLITVSDWGVPMIFENTGRGLRQSTQEFSGYSGWWNAILAHDVDGDGDLDLICGNKGTNLPYRPTNEAPIKLWVNDFDDNGGIEQITTIHYDNGDYPIHMRKELTEQLPYLKKENLKASDYATRTINEIFDPQVLERTILKEARVSASGIFENQGGTFVFHELPNRVQFSCVCGIVCTDINQDGNVDILMAGNNFEFKPQYSRLDASYGNLLLGKGGFDFEWQPYEESGFFVRDEVKHLQAFKDQEGRSYFIAAINDRKPKVFASNQ